MTAKFKDGDRVRVAQHVEGLAGMVGTVTKNGTVRYIDGGCPVLLDEDEDQLPARFDDDELTKEG